MAAAKKAVEYNDSFQLHIERAFINAEWSASCVFEHHHDYITLSGELNFANEAEIDVFAERMKKLLTREI